MLQARRAASRGACREPGAFAVAAGVRGCNLRGAPALCLVRWGWDPILRGRALTLVRNVLRSLSPHKARVENGVCVRGLGVTGLICLPAWSLEAQGLLRAPRGAQNKIPWAPKYRLGAEPIIRPVL